MNLMKIVFYFFYLRSVSQWALPSSSINRPITVAKFEWHIIPLTWRLQQLILDDQILGLIQKKYTGI